MVNKSPEVIKKSTMEKIQNTPMLDESFLFRMIRMVNFFTESYEDAIPPEMNLSRREYHILIVIANHPGISAIKICELSGYSQMAVSRGIQNLLKHKRVIKKQDKVDKRKFNLTLSKEGMALYQKISPVSLKLEQEAISCLTPKQAKSLDEILSILSSQLTKKPVDFP